jgi:hypothetical protein
VEIVTFDAEISRVLFDVAPVVSVRIVFAVRFDPTAIERIFEPSLSLTLRLEAFAITDTFDIDVFDTVTPATVPPVIATAFAFWVPIVPIPRLVLAVVASEAPVPPSATARSVIPMILPPVMATLLASWIAIDPVMERASVPST